MKYKVGDKVRVKEDLEVGKDYGYHDVVEDMEKYKKKNEPIVEEIKKKSEKEKRDKEIEELIAKAIKKALAETGEEENKTVTE